MNALEKALFRTGDRRKVAVGLAAALLGLLADEFRRELFRTAAVIAHRTAPGTRLRVELGRAFVALARPALSALLARASEAMRAHLAVLFRDYQRNMAREIAAAVDGVALESGAESAREALRIEEMTAEQYVEKALQEATRAYVEELRKAASKAGDLGAFLKMADGLAAEAAKRVEVSWSRTLQAFSAVEASGEWKRFTGALREALAGDGPEELIRLEVGANVALFRRPRPGAQPGRELHYRYTQGDSASGICPVCAPFVGMVTRGDASDGVPVPPLHLNCVCSLVPIEADALKEAGGGDAHFDWLESLSTRDLSAVVGPVRARLVASGELSVRGLYDPSGKLYSLAEMGYNAQGEPVMPDGSPRKSRGPVYQRLG